MAEVPVKHDSITDIFRGQLLLFISGKPVAYGISANLEVGTSEIDVSNKMVAGGWEAPLPGINNYTLSSESLVTFTKGQLSATDLLDIQIAKGTVEVLYGQSIITEQTIAGGKFEPDLTKPHYKGIAMITSLSINSSNGDIAKCSTSLKGIGELKKQPTV